MSTIEIVLIYIFAAILVAGFLQWLAIRRAKQVTEIKLERERIEYLRRVKRAHADLEGRHRRPSAMYRRYATIEAAQKDTRVRDQFIQPDRYNNIVADEDADKLSIALAAAEEWAVANPHLVQAGGGDFGGAGASIGWSDNSSSCDSSSASDSGSSSDSSASSSND